MLFSHSCDQLILAIQFPLFARVQVYLCIYIYVVQYVTNNNNNVNASWDALCELVHLKITLFCNFYYVPTRGSR